MEAQLLLWLQAVMDSHECNVILSRNCSHIYEEGDDIMTNESLANNALCSIVNAQNSFVDLSVDIVIDNAYPNFMLLAVMP
jgi:hypothetical protein